MAKISKVAREGRLAVVYTSVSLLGFATDATILHGLMWAGVPAAWARVVSLFCAMQVTFLVNGLFVFRCLDLARPWRQWVGYMTTNGVGNFCNYWIFVTLVSTHWPVVSTPLFGISAGSIAAWMINYLSTRLLVFRKPAAVDISPCETVGPDRSDPSPP
jgi:putative flippase GtrA